jgi:sn-glycerol 3-phosphate transport system permease protein
MSHSRRALFRSPWLPWALVAPQLLIIFVFFYWPTGEALFWAFTLEQPWGGGNAWVGLQNFVGVFTDPNYWHSVRISVLYAVATTILAIGISLLLAMFVDRELTYTRGYRLAMIWPYAIAAPAVGVIFRFVFDPRSGVFSVLNQVYPGAWNPVLNGSHAMVMLVLAGAWQIVSYNFVFLLAGLQSIPRGLVEAARMDGAGPIRFLGDILLPLSRTNMAALATIMFVYAWNQYLWPLLVTTDPNRSTVMVQLSRMVPRGDSAPEWHVVMAATLIVMLPPLAVVMLMQRWFVRGLVATEK